MTDNTPRYVIKCRPTGQGFTKEKVLRINHVLLKRLKNFPVKKITLYVTAHGRLLEADIRAWVSSTHAYVLDRDWETLV
jgi:hypothetical protein